MREKRHFLYDAMTLACGLATICEAKRQAAYAQAKANYDNDIIKCRIESSTNNCYARALSRYEKSQRAAEREYKSCIQGN